MAWLAQLVARKLGIVLATLPNTVVRINLACFIFFEIFMAQMFRRKGANCDGLHLTFSPLSFALSH